MCPEPDFGLCYHSLMEYYRPSKEYSKSQLSVILARYFSRNPGAGDTEGEKPEKVVSTYEA